MTVAVNFFPKFIFVTPSLTISRRENWKNLEGPILIRLWIILKYILRSYFSRLVIIFWHEQAEHPGTPSVYKILLRGPSHKLQSISTSLQFSKIFTIFLSLNGFSIKISLLTFKTIMNGQPSYLHQLLIPQYTSDTNHRPDHLELLLF